MKVPRRPRIAVGFFGIPRCSEVCFPSIQDKVLNRLGALGEVRCFYHLYSQTEIDNGRSGERGTLDPGSYTPFLAFDGELELRGPALEQWGFVELLARGDKYRDDGKSLSNLVHQLNSLYRLTERIQGWNPEVVVFLRPDLLYHDSFEAGVIRRCLRAPDSVFVPYWQPWGGLNDRFAVCGARAYAAYGKRVEKALAFCEHTGLPLHAERLLAFALSHAKAVVRTVPWTASRVRLGGIVREESFLPPPGPWKKRLEKLKRKLGLPRPPSP